MTTFPIISGQLATIDVFNCRITNIAPNSFSSGQVDFVTFRNNEIEFIQSKIILNVTKLRISSVAQIIIIFFLDVD